MYSERHTPAAAQREGIKRQTGCQPLTVVRSRSTPLAFLLMADNAVRHVGFFQVGNLLLRELHGQSPDGIFQM